jgi:hypothetical protein
MKSVLSNGKTILTLVLSVVLFMVLVGCSNENPKDGLTNNPSIEDVSDAIDSIDHITSIEIVTEDNDPNGQLGKQGGYTGMLFFIYDLVEGNTEESAIEAGTDGGGSIEVYATVDDAEKRNSYLSVFDGTIFSSGSHTVLGTLVIRTSNQLTASQQQVLETAIINALQQK